MTTIQRLSLILPEVKKVILAIPRGLDLNEEMILRITRDEMLRRGAPIDELREIIYKLWAPPTGTGKLAGTPPNWTTIKAAQSGITRTVTNTTELNAAATAAGPGDTILLSGAGGPWTGQWNLPASGTTLNKILLVAESPGTWGSRTIHKTADKINITGSNYLIGGFKYSWAAVPASTTKIILVSGSGVDFSDIEFSNTPLGTSTELQFLTILNTAHNTKIHHCDFNGINAFQISYNPLASATSPFATGVIVEYNNLTGGNNKWMVVGHLPNPYQDNERLLVTGVITRYNNVLNCESSEWKTSGNKIYRNYIEGSSGSGIGLRGGLDNVAEGNYLKSCAWAFIVSDTSSSIVNNVMELSGSAAVALNEGSTLDNMTPGHANRVYNSSHVRCDNTLIASNTVVGGTLRDVFLGRQQTGRHGAAHPQPYSPRNTKIIGNIFSSAVGVRIFMRNPGSVISPSCPPPLGQPPCLNYLTSVDTYHKYVGTEIKNNSFYLAGAAPPTSVIGDDTTDGGTPTGYINWNHATLTSGTVISGNLESNPNLSSVYRITGAPCQNAGIAYNINSQNTATMFDWDGNQRTQGAAPDMGVIEVGSSTPPATGTYALFGGGFTTVNVSSTDRYKYSDNTVTAGTALDMVRRQHGAAGNATVGIFAAGFDSANLATTTQYTYATDVVAAGTSISSARRQIAGVSTATVGYFGGGLTSVTVATVDKYTYTTSAVSAGGNLSQARDSMGACGDSLVGLFGGGFTTAVVATVDRYTYTTDSASAGASLLQAREDLAAAGDNTIGVFGAGTTGSNVSTVDKYDYGTTTVSAGTNLATARQELAAAGSDTVGYFAGGTTTAVVDKYTFATSGVAAGTALGTAKGRLAGAGGVVVSTPPPPPPPSILPAGGLFALFGGGFTTVNVTSTDRYVYATEVVTAGQALGTARRELAAVGHDLGAVFAGGLTTVVVSTVDKYTYSGDVVAAGTVLGTAKRALAAAGNALFGLFGGGFTTVNVATVDKYTYAGDVVVSGTALETARESLAATGDSSLALFGGGLTTAVVAVVDSYVYSNGAVAAGNALTAARHSLAAASNPVLGVFGGGNTGSLSAVTDRYIYLTDEVLAGTVLATAREDLAAAGNSTFGLFCAGFTTVVVASTDKFTYETGSVTAGVALGTARRGLAGAGAVVGLPPPPVTTAFGVFGGGFASGNSAVTDRYVYASDTTVVGASLATARYSLSAVSNAAVGIFAGGIAASTAIAITDKYTYSVNTVTPGTVLLVGRRIMAGAGSSTVGVMAGGIIASGARVATSELYTYAVDAIVAGANLGTSRSNFAAAGNETLGIFAAGAISTGAIKTTERYDYAANIVTPGTDLYWLRQALAAKGNATVGVFAGGLTGNVVHPISSTERYTFSSHAVSPGNNLQAVRYNAAAVGDANVGIFGGGTSGASTSSTSRYTYTTDAVISGGELSLARTQLAGASAGVFSQTVLHTIAHQKHRGLCSATYQGLVLVGDYVSGSIYHQDSTYHYDDAGTGNAQILVLKRRVTPVVYVEGCWLFYDRLLIEMEVGDILDPAQLELTWSDNGGVSLNANVAARNLSVLNPNSPLGRAVFNRLGKARWRAWQLDVSAPIRLVITGAQADITKGKA